ncbi:MAG TPA: NAD-dependent epimerase/dehydratase family protein [Dermatophilaceae bacterium]
MRIAVTGASGLVGGQVVRAALADGHEVTAIVRSTGSPQLRGLDLRQVRAGLMDARRLGAALQGVDGLVHCAAVYAFGADRADEVERVNAQGTRAVIESAARAGVGRVVVTSSSVTCGSGELPSARDESASLGQEPTSAYFASKVAQEQEALSAGEASGIPVVLALPTLVLGGPFGRLAPSNAIVLRYLLDPTRSTYPGGCNVVDVRDVARGHLLLLEQGEAGQRYLLGGQDLTWRMLHTLVAELAGLPGPYAEVPAPVAWVASAVAEGWAKLTGEAPLSTREEALTIGRYYWYSSERAARLGYQPRVPREAVAASLAWLVISDHVPRFVRESLTLAQEVRKARPLTPSQT